MRHLRLVLLSSFIYSLLIASSAFAVETIISPPVNPIGLEPIEIQLTINGARAGKNYLKAEFFKKDSTEYFGETFNGQAWYSGGDHEQYFPADITDSPWQGSIRVKIGENQTIEPESEYFLRVRRFTQSGSYNIDEAAASAVTVILPVSTSSPSPSPSSVPTASPSIQPSTLSPTYSLIFINEVFPYPSEGENEWVELYNFNDFSVSLENWYIDDIDGGSSPKLFSVLIPAKSYATLELSSSIFNNDGDSVRLMDSQKALKDSLFYETVTVGKSIGRQSFTETSTCLQLPSKGNINSTCISPTVKPAATNTLIPTPTLFAIGDSTATTDEEFETLPTSIPFHTRPEKILSQETLVSTSPPGMILGASSELPKSWVYRGLTKGFLSSAVLISIINCVYIAYSFAKKTGLSIPLKFA